jgi:hypothetical protein
MLSTDKKKYQIHLYQDSNNVLSPNTQEGVKKKKQTNRTIRNLGKMLHLEEVNQNVKVASFGLVHTYNFS